MTQEDGNQEVYKEILQQQLQQLQEFHQGANCFGRNATLCQRLIEFAKNGLQAQKQRRQEARMAVHPSSLCAASGDCAAKAVHVR
eukprot:CAMPEP_0197678200 /NCGR_PEP_ID=MMETSP1338-20131121/89647_1 /TAXON_ID=43686 ORGANISM="Pelagodinium beii, Strain RCC1491" /NCGR_SAMPLE_ID=MMETSP1338 /ASSEMBLY_ACC=CAM_ASM_000754 /LENGTH=84 /DNA_ID=CAMNT_0043259119 /DNA_START=242 /DNA_END=493 /DNA_ORIENTATION=+